MKLLNQNGPWVHQENAWTLTAEGSEGNIEDQSSGKVLGLLNNGTDIGTLVVLESKKRSVCSKGQKWLRDTADEGGWFRLKNPLSGGVLTAQDQTIISITGTLFIIFCSEKAIFAYFCNYFSAYIGGRGGGASNMP